MSSPITEMTALHMSMGGWFDFPGSPATWPTETHAGQEFFLVTREDGTQIRVSLRFVAYFETTQVEQTEEQA